MPSRVIAFTADLMFSSNIDATLRQAGRDVAVVEDLVSLERELAMPECGIVILDLHSDVEAGAVVMLCAPKSVPVLAFGRHTEPHLLRDARDAGCVEVVPRSTFVEEMASLVNRLAAS
ncbi:MAG TPA: hypothetical protein VFX19_13345 [Dehalococcoidia bacterium]|jgi:DNA-binding response OmpR family regulator|nr:hypothetical protein [Dehalococcoidia bacterium]